MKKIVAIATGAALFAIGAASADDVPRFSATFEDAVRIIQTLVVRGLKIEQCTRIGAGDQTCRFKPVDYEGFSARYRIIAEPRTLKGIKGVGVYIQGLAHRDKLSDEDGRRIGVLLSPVTLLVSRDDVERSQVEDYIIAGWFSQPLPKEVGDLFIFPMRTDTTFSVLVERKQF